MGLKTLPLTDVSSFLEPIPGKNPSGEFLRYTNTYDKIKEARREDDESLSQGVWKTEFKKADWEQVSSLCQKALKTKTKDLQIAIWLAEAWLRLYGLEGVAKGLQLIIDLTHTYWDTFYPIAEGDLRVDLYGWINTHLSEEVRFVPLNLPTSKASAVYSLLDLNRKGNHQEKISLSLEQTPLSYYQQMDESCILTLKILESLTNELRHHVGEEAPAFYRFKERVGEVQRVACGIIEKRSKKKEEKKMPSPEKPVSSSSKKGEGKTIENREQAYAFLGEIAAYLQSIEPHSPTPYLIQRAISWGNMSLPQVVSTVLSEDGNLSLLLDILNVKKDQQQEG
jgi:type VI secretion system ImpA family protein